MIDKNKYPKTFADFEKWLDNHIGVLEDFFVDKRGMYCNIEGGISYLPDEMQAGIFIKYFDGCGIFISLLHRECLKSIPPFQWKIKGNISEGYKIRIDSIIAAMNKASEIREKQLK